MENPITAPMDKHVPDFTDRAFRISLYLKGLHGLVETIGGLLLLVIKPEQINRLAERLTQGELSQEPHDFAATHILSAAHHLTGASLTFAAIYLLSHGVVKLVLIIEVLRDKLWAYPALLAVVGLFIIYQIYLMVVNGPSVALISLTIFDSVVIYLTQKEYRRHRTWHELKKRTG